MNRRFLQAFLKRDPRYDGKFFVGVKTTGIYCRPICPARPKPENIEFLLSREEAERAGYRACLRCRPEAAPNSPAWMGKSAVVQRALKILKSEKAVGRNEDEFAAMFGITARHLRRLFMEEIGQTPKQVASDLRLAKARRLLLETEVEIADAALQAGFKSVRRFNDAFKSRFHLRPTELRRLK